ncbi:FAD-dependent oxidoreductase [Paraflavitalea sp. CAU 1676]|uniref:FAD-dependent oxidoreductase n=1 Tax=Paraflavitalea sp. CAU 1676 TaxID=3032598 RepID=UPI0023DA2E56|nr:FAD-dependent oxidoreductase [Paraflavitalea sp. CAU 1676]MDF2190303.1 FAD-dependent oxidoreductase [Paraflavitalea sp. CAU 1676]
MLRDGACESIWQTSVTEFVSRAAFIPVGIQDVVIVGGGITGITTALLLQQAGKRCVVVEAHNIGFGTTGGTTAHLNTFMDSSYAQIKQNFSAEDAQLIARGARQSIDLIKSNIERYNIACKFRELPGYLFSTTEEESSALESIIAASKEAGVAVGLVNETVLPIPYHQISIWEGQAQFHPLQYLHGIAKAFEAAGGVLLQGCRVLHAEDNETIEVITTKGNIKCRQLIYATHIPPGVNLLHFRCAPYRSYVLGVKLKGDGYPDAVAYDMHDPYHYYRTEEVNGEKYLIVGGEDHKTGHEDNTEACFRRLESHVRNYFEVASIPYKWSSQYFEPTDGLPYIGHLPGHPGNIYVATGFGGNGMIYGTLSGMLLRDLIVSGASELEELLDPNRIKPVAGFANFVKEAADVAGKWVGGLFPQEKLPALADMAPGEGRIVEFEGKKMGIYKDERGKVYAIDPGCTHIKCTVQWNNAEKSWDCPCHGSRFSFTGEVLTGPARKSLAVYDVKQGKVVI